MNKSCFPSLSIVGLSRLKKSIWPTIYLLLEGTIDSCFFAKAWEQIEKSTALSKIWTPDHDSISDDGNRSAKYADV